MKHINATNLLICLMVVLLMLMSFSIVNGSHAAKIAQTAKDDAKQVKADLDIHKAEQNGSLGSINSGLNTLKQYRSEDRSEQQEFRDEVKVEIKDLRVEIQGLRDLIVQGLRQPVSTD